MILISRSLLSTWIFIPCTVLVRWRFLSIIARGRILAVPLFYYHERPTCLRINCLWCALFLNIEDQYLIFLFWILFGCLICLSHALLCHCTTSRCQSCLSDCSSNSTTKILNASFWGFFHWLFLFRGLVLRMELRLVHMRFQKVSLLCLLYMRIRMPIMHDPVCYPILFVCLYNLL